jgi:pyruvate, water dikinase
MTSQHLVRRISDVGIGDRPVVGGKGASLGELSRAGLRVPAGYVVTAQAFERALRALDPSGAIRRKIERLPADDGAAIARVTARIRGRIAAAPLPGDVQEAITASYRELRADRGDGGGNGKGAGAGENADRDAGERGAPVAVRSSATAEDSAEASFAGLQDTFLWVRGAPAVLDSVRRCWASLYNAEAVSYRLRKGISEQALAMGVVVQRMVDPRSAGVMFTCSPTTGDRSVIAIEGSWGLGSVLVSGEVTPDSYVVSKVTGEIVRRTVAAKLRLHRLDQAGSGITGADVPEDLRERACLTDDEIRVLAGVGQQVESHYGKPQDIEWALTEGGGSARARIVLLQSRPETVWTGRAGAPIATPKARAVDHVFEHLSRVVPVPKPER